MKVKTEAYFDILGHLGVGDFKELYYMPEEEFLSKAKTLAADRRNIMAQVSKRYAADANRLINYIIFKVPELRSGLRSPPFWVVDALSDVLAAQVGGGKYAIPEHVVEWLRSYYVKQVDEHVIIASSREEVPELGGRGKSASLLE